MPSLMSTRETATRPANSAQYAASTGTDPRRIALSANAAPVMIADPASSVAPAARGAPAAKDSVMAPPRRTAGASSVAAAGSGAGSAGRTMRPLSESRNAPATNPPAAQPATRATFIARSGPLGLVVGVLSPGVVGDVDDAEHLGNLVAQGDLDPLGERHPRH